MAQHFAMDIVTCLYSKHITLYETSFTSIPGIYCALNKKILQLNLYRIYVTGFRDD